jgi:hypothetical protein
MMQAVVLKGVSFPNGEKRLILFGGKFCAMFCGAKRSVHGSE